MAEPYLTNLNAFLARIDFPAAASAAITGKHFFSGAAAYAGGHIFMSLSPAGLALKLPQSDCDVLFAQGATPLQYFPKAPVKKGYVVLPDRLVADNAAVAKWMLGSIAFVLGE